MALNLRAVGPCPNCGDWKCSFTESGDGLYCHECNRPYPFLDCGPWWSLDAFMVFGNDIARLEDIRDQIQDIDGVALAFWSRVPGGMNPDGTQSSHKTWDIQVRLRPDADKAAVIAAVRALGGVRVQE